jgi:hypothetical protein
VRRRTRQTERVTNAITAGAAVAAAVFSLVNVLISNRYARVAQVQQWRRESMKETAAKFLNAIAAIIGGERSDELVSQAEVLVEELDLIASTQCANAGRQLYDFVTVERAARSAVGQLRLLNQYTEMRLTFLNLCRKDLGVDRFAWPSNAPRQDKR